MSKNYFKNLLILLLILFTDNVTFSQSNISTKSERNELDTVRTNAGFIKNCGQVIAMEGGKAKNVYYTFNSSSDVGVFITRFGISYLYKRLLDKKTIVRENKASLKHSLKEDSNSVFHYAVERADLNIINARIDTAAVNVEYAEKSVLYNYYKGKTVIVNQRPIKKIVFKNIYPGIDWILYSMQDSSEKIKYDFVVHEGADASKIKLSYSSNLNIHINKDSGITVSSKFGFIEEGKPVIISNKADRNNAFVYYKLKHNIVEYKIDERLKNTAFVIDPDLVWGTFLHTLTAFDGIHGSEVHASDVVTDAAGNIFVALKCSGNILFPTVNPGAGAYFSSIYDSENGSDVYMKFNAERVLIWSTYFATGGHGAQITVNSKGELIAAGSYDGGELPFKDDGGYFDSSTHTTAGYIAKFSNNGNLLWCTNFNANVFNDIITDKDDNILITGNADPNIILRKDPGNGAYIAPFATEYCIFISKFDVNCNLIWCTPMQSSANGGDDGSRLAIDSHNNIYLLGQLVRSQDYVRLNAGGYYQTTPSLSVLSRFNSSLNLTWSTYVPGYGYDVAADTSGNIFVVGQSFGGNAFPYVNPGNGAYTDLNKSFSNGGGYVMRFDASTNLTWSTTYDNSLNFFFEYILYEKYRNLIHIYGNMNDGYEGLPTHNDACNGSYYYSSTQPNTFTDPVLLTFTTGGKSLYASLNGFPYASYDIAECTVDNKGNLFYVFDDIQEAGPLITFPALKNPGNGAYYSAGTNNDQSAASFIMELKPSSLNADTSYTLPKNCNCNGSLSVIPYCGSGNYKYQWNRGDSTATITNVCPGDYAVKLTDLSSYNDTVIHFHLSNPAQNINGASFIAITEHCNKGDGEIKVSNIQGGPAPYMYSLDNQSYSTDSVFKNLNNGVYFINVKDKDGCVFGDSATVTNVPGPSQIITSALPSACDSISGKIYIDSIEGGAKPYMYAFNNSILSTKTMFAGLAPGYYSITVFDSALCKLEDSVTVVKAQPPASFVTNIINAHCNQSIGALSVTAVSGGTAPFQYSVDSLQFFSTKTFNNLSAGNTKIYVRDSNGCVVSDTFTIQNIPGPQNIIFTKTDALCGSSYGKIVIDSIDKGTAPFKYSINASSYNSNGVFNNVLPGKTIILAEDAFNCSNSDSTIINSTVALSVSITLGDTTICLGDELTLTALTLSTNNDVQYFWNGASVSSNTYSNRYYSNTPVNLNAKDSNGCTANSNVTIQVKYCDSLLAKCVSFPSAFTPNSDGLNDAFGAHAGNCEIKKYKLVVYNRWGAIVFQTSDVTKRWDGNVNSLPQATSSFIYYCEWQDELGVTRSIKGTVTLLR